MTLIPSVAIITSTRVLFGPVCTAAPITGFRVTEVARFAMVAHVANFTGALVGSVVYNAAGSFRSRIIKYTLGNWLFTMKSLRSSTVQDFHSFL